MQAQRKFEQPAAPVAEPEEAFDWTPRLAEGLRGQASPTHLLWDELAQRLQETPRTVAAPMAVERKWPVPMRLATILGLSAVAWAGVYVAVAAIT